MVDARIAGDENLDSSVVAETMKLLGNSSYGYQIMDRSRHTETKYLNYEKTQKTINGKSSRVWKMCRRKFTKLSLQNPKLRLENQL